MEEIVMHPEDRPIWNIRPAASADVPAIAAIIRGLGWFSYVNDESTAETETRIMEHLRMCVADDSHSVLVAEGAGGAILGYVAVHWLPYLMLPGPEGYISELFVAESAQGAGLGSKLLEMVKDMAIGRGCSRLMLVNRKTRESYKRGFYRKLGWEEREEFANFVLHLPQKSQWRGGVRNGMEERLIAPCGMNCGICSAYLAWSHIVPRQRGKTIHCAGCRPRDKKCGFIQRQCPPLLNRRIGFCFECSDSPCPRLQRLDERYRKKYKMSMIENLRQIKEDGMEAFLSSQQVKYRCAQCGGTVCVHNGRCYDCEPPGN